MALTYLHIPRQGCSIFFHLPCFLLRCAQTAERLYLSGAVTYPRTETTKYPASFDLRGTALSQASNPYWGAYVKELLSVSGQGVCTERPGQARYLPLDDDKLRCQGT